MRISKEQIAAALEVAGLVQARQLRKAEGIAKLAREYQLQESSARIYIDDFQHLLAGRAFRRTMSAPAMRLFLERIHSGYGQTGLASAIRSLHAHIDYYEGHKGPAPEMRAICDEFAARLETQATAAQLEREFEERVSKSLRDPQSARLRRLAGADTKAKTATVRSIVFVRNPDVAAEVLNRAGGRCERCQSEAPFRRARDGTPYLEVHHKIRLADGGEDSVENAIAVCPNCHRFLHFGVP